MAIVILVAEHDYVFPYRIDAEGVVKVADFGLTENMNVRQRKKAKHEEKVPIRWMAPETIENCVCTEATDVVSHPNIIEFPFSHTTMYE